MPTKQHAIVSRQGIVLGQALACGPFVLAPLHVVDDVVPSPIQLVNAAGDRESVTITRVFAREPTWDLLMLQTIPLVSAGANGCLAPINETGIDVHVHAIVQTGYLDRSGYKLAIVHSRIRDCVRVESYVYGLASGRKVTVNDFLALFLDHPFPPGWSGAPVYLPDAARIVGFVHGNAFANGGAGVCLLPSPTSKGLQLIRQLMEPTNG